MSFQPTLIGLVEQVFEIRGRGCVIVPEQDLSGSIQPNTEIELRRPDGSAIRTHVVAVEPVKMGANRVAFMLPPDIAKDALPVRTQIWLV